MEIKSYYSIKKEMNNEKIINISMEVVEARLEQILVEVKNK